MALKKDYKFRIGLCSFCDQGWIEVFKKVQSLEAFYMCNECFMMWHKFESISTLSKRNLYFQVEHPSLQDIKVRRWEKYLLEDRETFSEFIGCGFMYDNNSYEFITATLGIFVSFFVDQGAQIYKTIQTTDENGAFAIEKALSDYDGIQNIVEDVSHGFNGNILMKCTIFNMPEVDITLRLIKKPTFFGILIDMPELQILKDLGNPVHEIEVRTVQLIELMKQVFSIAPYTYAVCDAEAQILYSLSTFEEMAANNMYSLAIIPDASSGSLKTIRGNRQINIVTIR